MSAPDSFSDYVILGTLAYSFAGSGVSGMLSNLVALVVADRYLYRINATFGAINTTVSIFVYWKIFGNHIDNFYIIANIGLASIMFVVSIVMLFRKDRNPGLSL